MTAQLIDGKSIAAEMRTHVKQAVVIMMAEHAVTPSLAVVLVGADPASQVYVTSKVKQTRETGMISIEHRLAADTPQAIIIALVKALNVDTDVDGILVQLPLPPHIDTNAVIATIAPEKDVDGLTEISAGRLALGRPGLRPCTPFGCIILAKNALGSLKGANVVILGRSILVGRPAAQLFLAEDCTVTIAHSHTRDLPSVTRSADILVPAVGRPEFVRGNWIRPGATVIDVGINRIQALELGDGKTRLVGDIAFQEALETAGHITPVPGGVGPMTIACLLRNTVLAACQRRGLSVPAVLDN